MARPRTNNLVPALAGGPRPIPPLPHPSWLYGPERGRAERISARDFWERIGL
jgi:hypothetical protein